MSAIPKTATCVKGGPAQAVPKMSGMGACYCGRRGMPREWIEQMYADYLRLGSLEKVGDLHGRSRQSVFDIFKRRGLKLNPKKFLPVVLVNGRKFTEQKTAGRHRYLRATIRKGKTLYLHHQVWEQANGPIPAGHKVCFKDGDHRNTKLDNLELLTNSEEVRKYASKGQNQFTGSATARMHLFLRNFQSGQVTLTGRIKR